ncbi:CCA tRNA nucleotidyltransferase [Streptococcus pyogenes]|uniref:CCA tRNA nucleotidyltransferase n=1 Tax=Streptococcus pyogenes TaxID=1314 RepID=UPI0001E0FA3D|nr:CCA tRNA nucleotidyltransferase [Streptococcus pyogenes]EFM33270.1 tRNA nucleotidyltransferase/poly(A) polymerase family protein [Streptococcus pyogenes ATCC 10782]SQE38903.1 poly A polymerase head domain-containing protein [Streptococcus pyogenes]SQF45118.1 poly A polymerase head domain-containing protein [Streptococcus pyogenes]SUO48497.1 poly A polymerase head domain-containing protein [Streptococcus pyogenes]SUO76984.1 poly A polymerase head domain-containing protein [Streptococcus pyog
MKLMTMPSEFQKALPILTKIKEAGYEAYFVGGSVRDVLLERPIHDVDIATSSYPEETKAIFNRTVDVGIEHGTVLVLENGGEYEITTFRTEDVYVDYRRPSQVSFVRSLEEDLKRRDFTVNALALDENGQVIDKFRGLIDLKQKRLRAVGKAEERFEEDALRIMRGFRFAASLDFDIEAATFEAMRSHSPLLEKISVERSFTEFDKLLMAPHWRKGISAMIACQAYDYLPGLKQQEAGLNYLIVSLKDNFTFSDYHQAWAYVMISLAIEDPKSFLKAWKTSNDFQRYVTKLIALYRIRQERSFEKLDIYQYGKEMASLVEGLRKAQSLSVDMDHIEALDQALAIHDKHDIVLNGSHLIKDFGMKPGPQLGLMLEKVELAIVEGRLDNDFTTIEAFVREELAP